MKEGSRYTHLIVVIQFKPDLVRQSTTAGRPGRGRKEDGSKRLRGIIVVMFKKVWLSTVILLNVTLVPWLSAAGPGKLEVTSELQSTGTAVEVAVDEVNGVPPKGCVAVAVMVPVGTNVCPWEGSGSVEFDGSLRNVSTYFNVKQGLKEISRTFGESGYNAGLSKRIWLLGRKM
jgi:hypothetical protein